MSSDLILGQQPGLPVSPWKAGRIYWACQIVGWTLMFVLNQIASLAVMPFHWRYLLGNVAVSVVGLTLTHVVRAISRARRWELLPIPQLLPRFAIAVLACDAVTLGIFFGVYLAVDALFGPLSHLTGSHPKFNWKAGALLVMATNLAVIYLSWCGIYYGVQLIRRQQRAETERWRLQAALASAELAGLKAQLNPHFLFNALNSLRALVLEDPARAQEMVTRLAAILRYSLQASERETVPLRDELKMVDDYLGLEAIRFEERLRVTRDIAPDTADVAVPPMLVQTLVENAIKHGISRQPGGGDVHLSARIDATTLEVEVSNPGTLADRNGTGTGLRNAAQRIHRLWADTASLQLLEHEAGRVIARLRIPR